MVDRPFAVVTLIHGNWSRRTRWPDLEQAVSEVLSGGDRRIEFNYFAWSGRNLLSHRASASAQLRQLLGQQISRSPGAVHIVITHSHGGNILLHALNRPDDDLHRHVTAIVLLSPPVLGCRIVDNPQGAANRLFLGAVTFLPMVVLAAVVLLAAFQVAAVARLVGALLVTTAWLAIFWPARVRRRAVLLADQLTLPRIPFSGLVVQVPGDEATMALSSVAAFERLARFVRSRILAVRAFKQREEQGLRRARTWRDVTVGVALAMVLIPGSAGWMWLLFRAVEQHQWLMSVVALPMVIVSVASAVTTVGGSVLLLLLLPACSFLLWPFGIFPTASAALLTVGVEPSPGETWRLTRVPPTSARTPSTWRHSTWCNATALDAVREYLRSVVGAQMAFQSDRAMQQS